MGNWHLTARGKALAQFGGHVDKVIIRLDTYDTLAILPDEDAEALYASLGEAIAEMRERRAAVADTGQAVSEL